MGSLVSRTIDPRGSITWHGDMGSITWQSCHIMGKWTAENTTVTLLHLAWFPRSFQVMKRHQALLDVGPRAHLLRAAKQHPDGAGADALKEPLFFGVGV